MYKSHRSFYAPGWDRCALCQEAEKRRDTSLCSKSALVWGHAQIAAELWSTLPHRNTSEAKLTVTLWRPQRYVDKSSCECRLCTHKEGIFHSVFLNLVFILFTFSLDREKGQKAFGAQILRYTPSPVDKAAKYKLNTQKRPVFYNGLKKIFLFPLNPPKLLILQDRLMLSFGGKPLTFGVGRGISDKIILHRSRT